MSEKYIIDHADSVDWDKFVFDSRNYSMEFYEQFKDETRGQ